jgi:hypothetical protein
MQGGEQIKIKRELNIVGKEVAGIIAGDTVFSKIKLLGLMSLIGANSALLPIIVGILGASKSFSPTIKLIYKKLAKGEFYYEHHGILESSHIVIHEPGGPFVLETTKIERTTTKDFAKLSFYDSIFFKDNQSIQPVRHGQSSDIRDIITRSRYMIGKTIHNPTIPKQRGYDLTDRNCEHFAYWCRTGIWESEQVLKILGQRGNRVKINSSKPNTPEKRSGKIQTRQDVIDWCHRLRKGKQRKALCPWCNDKVNTANMVAHFDKNHSG